MIDLFATYSLSQIIVFAIAFVLALKELLSLGDFFKARKKLELDVEKKKEENQETLELLEKQLSRIELQIKILTESDKDDIKSWIVDKYHFYKENPEKKIDSFTMDTIEKRFKHYQEEGGNSYIETIMEELRQMAKEGY